MNGATTVQIILACGLGIAAIILALAIAFAIWRMFKEWDE